VSPRTPRAPLPRRSRHGSRRQRNNVSSRGCPLRVGYALFQEERTASVVLTAVGRVAFNPFVVWNWRECGRGRRNLRLRARIRRGAVDLITYHHMATAAASPRALYARSTLPNRLVRIATPSCNRGALAGNMIWRRRVVQCEQNLRTRRMQCISCALGRARVRFRYWCERRTGHVCAAMPHRHVLAQLHTTKRWQYELIYEPKWRPGWRARACRLSTPRFPARGRLRDRTSRRGPSTSWKWD